MRPACARLEVPSVGEARAEPSCESSPGSVAACWPAGAAAARAHRGSEASTRPFHAAFACAWRPRALSSTSASVCCHEHDHGPLEPPCRRQVARPGGCLFASPPVSRGVSRSRRSRAGSGVKDPNLDALLRDCSRGRLRPNPDRFRLLVSRAPLFAPVWMDTGRGRRRRRCARLRGARTEGSCCAGVPRRIPILTNPRGLPSQGGSNRAGCVAWACRSGPGRGPRLFHRRRFRARDARTGSGGSATRRGGMETIRSLAGGPQRPLATSAFE